MSEDDDRMLRYNTQIMAIYSDREFHRKKMEELEEQRLKIVRAKQMYCRLSGGHEIITQIESCMYGESYRVCKRCELDLN
jgi:methylphosphotriester-DNA--protein-cysteine methyltransferase